MFVRFEAIKEDDAEVSIRGKKSKRYTFEFCLTKSKTTERQ